MAPSKVDKSAKRGRSEETTSTLAPSQVPEDTIIKELAGNLQNRLCGGLHGEFFEKGSRLDDKHRSGQLADMFALTEALSNYQKHNEKPSDAEQAKTSKGGAVAINKNMIATVKDLIAQEMSEKFRDLSLQNERLEVQVKKGQAQIESLEVKVKTLEIKNKKADERNHRLEEKLLESNAQVENKTKIKTLQTEMSTLKTQLNSTRREVEQQATQALAVSLVSVNERIDTEIAGVRTELVSAERDRESSVNAQSEELEEIKSNKLRRMSKSIKRLRADVDADCDAISNIQRDELPGMQSSIKRLGRNIRAIEDRLERLEDVVHDPEYARRQRRNTRG